jgi:DNA adenine methylase
MIFRYPGGKSKKSIRERIIGLAPAFSEYREPLVGGGGIFFAIDTAKKRWINDINPHLMEVYKDLQNNPDDFIKACRDIPPALPDEEEVYPMPNSKGKKYNKRLKAKFDELKYNEQCKQSLRYYFINRTVYAGRVNFDPRMSSRMYFSHPEGWNIVKTDKLERASELLSGVRITVGSYEPLLEEDGDNVWIYLDPPYYKDSVTVDFSQLYGFPFALDDHAKLANQILRCKHKVLISYDDHEEIRKLYSDNKFHIHTAEWKYCGTSSKVKRLGKELMITNYAL